MLLAPEHPWVDRLTDESPDSEAFRERVRRFRAVDRTARLTGELDKEGFDTGRQAINPFTGQAVPIWIANFVLAEYGTGAIMAVPAHDQRDFEFARTYALPIHVVIQPSDVAPLTGEALDAASTEPGTLVESGEFSGLSSREAIATMTRAADAGGFGHAEVQYRLKDWGVSRQRYWGTPIPIVYCDGCGTVPVPYESAPRRAAARRSVYRSWRLAVGPGTRVRPDDVPGLRRPRAPRDRHNGYLCRLVVVLLPLLRPPQ